MNQPSLLFLKEKDPILGKIIDTIPEPIIESTNDVFFDLVGCIVAQKIHYRGTSPFTKKLAILLKDQHPTPPNVLALDEKTFAEMKLSNNKYQTLIRLADNWQRKKMDKIKWDDLSDTEVKTLLMDIKGIGNWTADMILLYTLQRPNIFPFEDYHLKNIMVQLYELPPKSKLKANMLDIANDWAPYRSLAVKYLLAWKAHLKKKL